MALLLLLIASSASQAQSQLPSGTLLNAYHAPLSTLTAPHSHYFLDFPIPADDGGGFPKNGPKCANGLPYSFLFRRGSDVHKNKLLVEFESVSSSKSAPWALLQNGMYNNDIIPPLGSCRGISYGFMSRGASLLGFNNIGDHVDVPIFLRRGQKQKDEHLNSTMSMPSHQDTKAWWEHLGGDYSSVHDWSYLFVPHCTSEVGTAILNFQHVSDWVTTQFGLEGGGLDALVTVSGGGRIDGCTSLSTIHPAASFALSFAKEASIKGLFRSTSSKALVIMDGSTLWVNPALEDMVGDTLSSDVVEIAWVATHEENAFLKRTKQAFSDSFHIYRPSANDVGNDNTDESCPLYALPDISADKAFCNFINTISKNMPWAKTASREEEENNDPDADGRLSFLAIVVILLGVYLASWSIYFAITYHRRRQGSNQGAAVLSPHDLWFLALTKFPVLFLLLSIAVPVILSYAAYARNGYTVSVNLDFDTYLDITTVEEQRAMKYRTVLKYQRDSLKREESNCQELYRGKQSGFKSTEERLLKEVNEAHHHRRQQNRELKKYGSRSGRTMISFFYENRNGGTIFTPEVLKSVRQFEVDIMSLPGFKDLCHDPGSGCFPFDSIAPDFFPSSMYESGDIIDDIDTVLKSYPASKNKLSKMDKYFSSDNLGSNITMATLMLNDVNGTNKRNVHQFLAALHNELWAADQQQKYPDFIFSWRNEFMHELEANAALEHDFKWSLIALCFIGLMVFVKVFNVVAVLAGLLGLVLSFTAALYWQFHFDFNELTALHVAGIFVMLGIGADDIFLTIDAFEHTKVEFPSSNEDEPDPVRIKQRMVSAYKTAGSMMLVSSMTAALCFFSNIFSAVVVIRDFGSYMGMVIVCNYAHVMTILPSALLVNEIHIKPLQRKVLRKFICIQSNNVRSIGSDIDTMPCEESTQEDEEDTLVETPVSRLPSEITETGHDDTEDTLQTLTDDNFLHRTKDMTALDRFFVQMYAPFVYQWRSIIISTFSAVAVVLGILAWLNFSLYDGTLIVFKENYNLGRVQRIVDEYFPEGLVKMYLEEGFEDIDLSSLNLGSGNSVSVGSGFSSTFDDNRPVAPTSPPPNTAMPSPYPSSVSPSTVPPSSAPIDIEENITILEPPNTNSSLYPVSDSSGSISILSPLEGADNGTNASTGGILNASDLGVDGNQVPSQTTPTTTNPTTIVFESTSTPDIPSNVTSLTSSVWYPNWIGDDRGCLNDGKQPTYMVGMTESFLFDTLEECCDINFSWDISTNCFENYIDESVAPSKTPSVSNPPTEGMIDTPSSYPTLSPASTTGGIGVGSISNLPAPRITPLPTSSPTKSSITTPSVSVETSLKPTLSSNQIPTSSEVNNFQKREYYWVSMVWGMKTIPIDHNVWIIKDKSQDNKAQFIDSQVDPSDEFIQEWLLEIVTLARNDAVSLSLHPQLVWIEALKDFAVETGVGFPIPKELFIGLVERLKSSSAYFRKLVEREIGSANPGIAGEYLYTSVTFLSEVPLSADTSDEALKMWTIFTESVNDHIPEHLPHIDVQSDAFLDSLRTTAIVDSTVSTYFVANGLFLLVVLLFSHNLIMTLVIMLSLIAIFFCCGGFIFNIFQIEFGPVESLGVSIFVGLSSNYLLHIAHAYHKCNIIKRNVKIQRAVFVAGSPILWSAISTMGGSAFLFACRTWLLTELGILICTVIGLSLIFSLGFLLAVLACIGPLPIASDDGKYQNLHSFDLMSIFKLLSKCLQMGKSDTSASVEVVERDTEQSEINLPDGGR